MTKTILPTYDLECRHFLKPALSPGLTLSPIKCEEAPSESKVMLRQHHFFKHFLIGGGRNESKHLSNIKIAQQVVGILYKLSCAYTLFHKNDEGVNQNIINKC